MQLQQKKLPAILLIIFIVAAIVILTSYDTEKKTPAINSQESPAVKQSKSDASLPILVHDTVTHKQNTKQLQKILPEGVNTLFHDKPEVQVTWMERGKNIVVKNKPGADTADFRNTFFHRGAKARPVTCGEVQFRSDGTVIEDFQRFVYTGIQRTYLEDDVVNFDTFWEIMCKQTLDEYFDEYPQQ